MLALFKTFLSINSFIKGTPEVIERRLFDFFCSNMKQYSLGNIHIKFQGNPIHRSRSCSLYTHKLTGVCLYFLWKFASTKKIFFFRMESIISPTILKLEQCFFIAFRISYSTNVMDCILGYWNVIGNRRRFLKINVDFQKKIKIARCIP